MSWVIIDKENNKVIFETWQKSVTDKINKKKYKVMPILEYLYSLNNVG